ncbi:beta-lactamase-like protein [Triangularia verruculosa]|uniref:Beta-lactamase-like protein n=1 Tax=Triangularia verruculosa TaxID=2587418 RepID=A0AAN6XCF5_9PEZI|nr:beta-lactamase-like protein [Triangularia verruculosa]
MTPTLALNPHKRIPLLKIKTHHPDPEPQLPISNTKAHPTRPSASNLPSPSHTNNTGSIYFIGTATTILSWHGARILTDPNFLHAGDHVHLGPGVTAERLTNPSVNIDALPPLDCILLSHYHEDHFDRLVEDSLSRQFPIISTPHAKSCLTSPSKPDPFQNVTPLDPFDSLIMPITTTTNTSAKTPQIKVTAMPGKHVPPGPLSIANDLLGAVPPTNGWLLELGYTSSNSSAQNTEVGYRIYISGDTLLVDELKKIPEWLHGEKIDLMLVHLGGTTIPSPKLPLLMVTMDGAQGVRLMKMMGPPDVTIPIHYDDYDVFLSRLDDFKKEVDGAGLRDKVVYLDRGEEYRFQVRGL